MEKNNNYEIVPGKGYGNFIFGTGYEQIVEMIGEPDEVIRNEENGEDEFVDSLTAFFDDFGLAMFFEQLDEKGLMSLQSIEIDEPSATMYGKPIFGMTQKELVKLIEKQTGEKGIIEKDEEIEDFEIIDFENSGISLQIENDELVSVTLYNME